MVAKSRYSIAARLMFYSAVSVIIPVLIMGVLFTFFLNSRFREYLIQENYRIREELVSNLTQYLEKNTTLDQTWMEQFSNVYMEQGMFISLNSEDGDLMWSCLLDNSEICSMYMEENNLDCIDNLQTSTYEVPMGTSGYFTYLDISYISPDEYSGNDLFFLIETFKMLLLSMVISLIVSAVSSVFLSKSMSRPLESLTRYAVRLANHDYRAFDPFHKGAKEIDDLHSVIEQLAHSLESQENLRKRLTADISHELRTPLTTIQTSLEAMIDGIWPSDKERLQVCHDEILRLGRLVSGLDDLHSYDTAIKTIDESRINLKKSLISVFRLFENDFQKKGIKWTVEGDNIFIKGDEGKLKQVWINLLSNSLKFVERNGKISVSLSGTNPVQLIFTDNGRGIDAEDIPNIFERFYKADASRNLYGSGLGLSIVREILELHEGTIKVESIPNIGTDFIIEFPGE